MNRFQRPLDTISGVSRHMLVFYFLQTPEKLPPKYASFGHQCFSWVFLRIYSDRTNDFLTYCYSSFIDLTSKYSKISLYLLPAPRPPNNSFTFIFVSDICFHWSASCQLSLLLQCTLFYLGKLLHSVSEIFFSIQGLTFFFSLIFYLVSSPYL